MNKQHILQQIVSEQKSGAASAICSICSSHPLVLEAAVKQGTADGSSVLIEATANQVNQFGGYTGMRPSDFKAKVQQIAFKHGLPAERLILGGDHLGPLVWQKEKPEIAMDYASELIRQYVLSGFSKIHIDTSMHLSSDDPGRKLPASLIAERAAVLAQAASEAFAVRQKKEPEAVPPVFVIGSEVPIPGGAQSEEEMQITRVEDLEETLSCFKTAFASKNLLPVFSRVIAVVVQPGVEFGSHDIHDYDRAAARDLCIYVKKQTPLVLEGHSTDYQRTDRLREMAEDGVAILKAGPALTFALREGLVALEHIEQTLYADEDNENLSHFAKVLDQVMLGKPHYWLSHYSGDERAQRLSRIFSLSDRCRYYLGERAVVDSIDRLVHNLRVRSLPLTLLSQYLPDQYRQIRLGQLAIDPEALLVSKIGNEISRYPSFRQN